MNPDWEHLESIFAEALELEPGERAAFLDRKCAGVPGLREEVDSLLRAHEEAGASFDTRSMAVRDFLGALGSSLLTGRQLGAYEMGPIIGEGGMGVIYQATDTRNSKPVAVKVLPRELSVDSPWRKRFSREVRATQAVYHPNVVRILDCGEDAGCLFLVMELIPGESLRAVLARGALALAQVLNYGAQIAAALEAAHAAGVIHHDLKPGNIMVTPEGELKVVDFGLSRFEGDSGDTSRSRVSQVGTPAGTIDYLSPEQAGGRGVDWRSDLFATGSVLYEMLTGRRAFHRATNLETAAAILRDQPKPLPDSVPASVVRLVEKCLAKEPEKRMQSAGELRRTLEDLRGRFERGKLKPRRFRRARRIAAWTIPAALAAAALIYAIAIRGASPDRPLHLRQFTDDPHITDEPALSYNGRWLAYASDRAEDGNVDIWIQPTGPGEARRLTTDPAVDHQPSLSPDGSVVAFRSERKPAGIYTMPSSGGPERLLVAGGRQPRYSPDGKWIAYWTGPEVNGDAEAVIHAAIFVIPAAGGTPRQLAGQLSAARHPVWAADSASLLFSGHRDINDPNVEFWTAPIHDGSVRMRARWVGEMFNSEGPPEPFAWIDQDRVLLSWYSPTEKLTATAVWRLRLPAHPENEPAAPQRLTSGLVPFTWATADGAGRIMVSGGPVRSAIWGLPIEADTAKVRAPMSPLPVDGDQQMLKSLSDDGKQMIYRAADRHGVWRYVLQNLESGQEDVLSSDPHVFGILLGRDGRSISIQTDTSGSVDLTQLVKDPPGMSIRKFRYPKTNLWDLTRDGSQALEVALTQPRTVKLETFPSEQLEPLLVHPKFNLYLANFSSDDRWILVTAENGLDPAHLFAVPFRKPYPIPISEWVDLGEGTFGRWAPSGNRIYFLRDHEGSRCLYTVALDPATKRPVGEVDAVEHFHSAWRSPLQLVPGYFRLIVARDKLVFLLGEAQANLWVAER